MSTRDKSNKIKEAVRQGFLGKISKLADRKCFGYDNTADGTLVINWRESEIVQWIFESNRSSKSFGKIVKDMEKCGIPSPTGRRK